jgi:hypothetical protein
MTSPEAAPTSIQLTALAMLLGFVLVFGAGCGADELMDRTVTAKSPVAFNAWQSRFASRATPEERRQFETALQEIRYKIMADKEATGSDPISDALRTKVHGRSVREVLQLGVELRLLRLLKEHAALHTVMRQNAMLQTREGDRASEDYLVQFYQKQLARLEKLEEEIEAADRELAPLMDVTRRSLLPKKTEGETDNTPIMLRRSKWRA